MGQKGRVRIAHHRADSSRFWCAVRTLPFLLYSKMAEVMIMPIQDRVHVVPTDEILLDPLR